MGGGVKRQTLRARSRSKAVGQECPTHTGSEIVCFGSFGGGVVAFAGVDAEFVAVFFDLDFDGAVLAIALEEGGLVGDEITAADDLLQGDEATVETANGAGREVSSAGEFG